MGSKYRDMFLKIAFIAPILLFCISQILKGEPTDSANMVIDSTIKHIADSVELKSQIDFIHFIDQDSLIQDNLYSYGIPNKITNTRIPNSIRDLVKSYSGFYSLTWGPYGQSSVIIHDGLPVNKYRIGDFIFDYRQFNLPVNGLIDSRLISPAHIESVGFTRLADLRNFDGFSCSTLSPRDSGALTSAFMQKGDYGFSNTMVRFAAAPGARSRFGFSAGFKLSDAYIENTKKNLENYRFHTEYQLNENYQFQQDMIFFTANDQIRFTQRNFNYNGESESSWWGTSLALAASEKTAVFKRAAFIYQRYTESVRNGVHPKYRQLSESYMLKINNNYCWSNLKNRIIIEPYLKRVTFDPDGDSYAGIGFNDYTTYNLSDNARMFLSASTDINKYSDTDISLTFGANYKLDNDLSIAGQAYRVSENPSDYDLFASSQGIQRAASAIDYYFEGDRDLGNTGFFGYRFSAQSEKHGFNTEIYIRQEKIKNYHWWEEYKPTDSTFGSRIISRDMNLIAGGIDLTTTLPFDLMTRLSYSYSRLQDSDNNQYLTFNPRNNLYLSFIRKLYIPHYDLHVLLNLEGEYHSTNYTNCYIPLELDDNFFLNFKLHLKIKALTFFYNMDNVLDEPYPGNDGYQLGRGVWWGFMWNFIN